MPWEWHAMRHDDTVPDNAVPLFSTEGKRSYVGRAKLHGSYVKFPGEVVIENSAEGNHSKYVHINYNGQDARIQDDFEVLVAPPGSYYWSPYEDLENSDQACKYGEDFPSSPSIHQAAVDAEPVSFDEGIFYIARTPADKYGHRGGFAIKSGNLTTFHFSDMQDPSKIEMLMRAPRNLLMDSKDDDDETMNEIFGWTEWNDKLNLKYVASAGRIKDGDDTVLVARTILERGKYLYGGLVLDSNAKKTSSQFGPGLESDPLRVDVLLATPGRYFWTKPPPVPPYPPDTVPWKNMEDQTLEQNEDYRCVARAIYRYRPCVGEVGNGLCYLKPAGPGYYSKEYEVLIVKRPGRSLECEYFGWAPYHRGMSVDFVAKLNYDRSRNSFLVISRTLLPHGNEHSFEQHESIDNILPNGSEVLLYKQTSNLTWVPEHSGYVPREAMIAGQNRDQERLHIGRFEQDDGMELGLVVPSSKLCASILSPRTGWSSSYQVLVSSKQSMYKAGATEPTQLLQEMQRLQNKYFHGEYGTSTGEFHTEITQLQYRNGDDLFVETEEWIPFMARLARVHGLPHSFKSILFKFMEGPCNSERNPKYRVARIILSCTRDGFMQLPGNSSVSKLFQPREFMPLLQYFLSLSANGLAGAPAQLEVILEAVVFLCKPSKSVLDLDELSSAKLRDLLTRCTKMVSPAIRSKILKSLPNQLLLAPESGTSSMYEKEQNLKLKSLAQEQHGRPVAPVQEMPLTVRTCITALEHTFTEKGTLELADCNALYQSTAREEEQQGENVFQMSEFAKLLKKKSNASFAKVRSLSSFMQSDTSRPLESDKLGKILKLLESKSRLSPNTRHEYIWTVIASLSKYRNETSKNWHAIPSPQVQTLLSLAQTCSRTKESTLLLGILTGLVHATGNFRLNASNVQQLAKLNENLDKGSEKYELIVQTFLRLLTDNVDAKNFHPSIIQVMTGYLKTDKNSTTVRIQSAAWFYRWTVELSRPLDKDDLSILQSHAQDNVRDVKLYSRAAYSNGLLNNVQLRADEEMLDVLPSIFVTYITEITELGGIQRDLTDNINGPIYAIFDSIRKELPEELGKVYRKFIINYALFCTASSDRTAFNKCLKALGKWCTSESLAAVEKVLKITDEERDVAEYAQFILSAIRNDFANKFTFSDATLQKIVKVMLGPKSHATIYPMALHIISGVQELPDDVFGYYHMELVALRLKNGGLQKKAEKFLQESNLNQGEDKFLLDWLLQHFQIGRRLSQRSVNVLLSCFEAKATRQRAELTLHSLVAEGWILRESDLLRLLDDRDGSKILNSKLMLGIMKNQDIPRQVISKLFTWLEGLPVRMEHLDALGFVHVLLSNHSNPCEITERSINLASKLLHKGVKLNDVTGILLVEISRKIFNTALATKDVPSTSLHKVKTATMVEKTFDFNNGRKLEMQDLEDSPSCDLVLMLELLDYDSSLFSWAEVNELVVRSNQAIWEMDTKIQKRIHQLYRCSSEDGCDKCTGPVYNGSCGLIATTSDERAHVSFDILDLKFCRTEAQLTKSACSFVHNGVGCAAIPFVDTSNLERVMQKSSQVAEKIRKAVTAQVTKTHLQSIGDCTFRSWSNSQNEQVYIQCTELLEQLLKDGWKPSEEAKDSLRILEHYGGPWIQETFHLAWPVTLITSLLTPHSEKEDLKPTQHASLGEKHANMKTIACVQTTQNPVGQASSILSKTFTINDLRAQAQVQVHLAKIYLALSKIEREQFFQQIVEDCSHVDWKNDGLVPSLDRICCYIEAAGSSIHQETIHGLQKKASALFLAQVLQGKLEQKCVIVGTLMRAGRLLELYNCCCSFPQSVLSKMYSVTSIKGFDQLVELLRSVDVNKSLDLPIMKSEIQLIAEVTARTVSSKLPQGMVSYKEEIDACLRPLLTNKSATWENVLSIKEWNAENVSNLGVALRIMTNYNLEAIDVAQQVLRTHIQPSFESFVPLEKKKKVMKTTSEITKEFALQIPSASELTSFVADVRGLNGTSCILQNKDIGDISSWDEPKIRSWARAAAKNAKVNHVIPIKEYLSVARRTFEILRGWRLTTVQILAAKSALEKTPGRPSFQQISTGLGKSAIIALVAAFQALHGKSVDIYTSSPVLALRDQQEWMDFYELMNLTCGQNEDANYHGGAKSCYERHIVYGDIKYFQFDALRQEYLGLETRGVRSYEFCIVDEVDSIFLDQASKLAILSTPISGIELLHQLYLKIWKKALELNEQVNVLRLGQRYYTYQGPGQPNFAAIKQANTKEMLQLLGISDRRDFMKTDLESYVLACLGDSNTIRIPAHLQDFAKSQASNWADSALTALALKLDKDYVILDDQVFPVDPNNGVTQRNSKWANALHQFLQIKHQLKVTAETLTTAFVSNKGILDKYKGNMVGFSGTLGLHPSADLQLLQSTKWTTQLFFDSQEIDVLKMPDLHSNHFWMFPDLLTKSKREWLNAIAESAQFESKCRGVLIICRTIKSARDVESAITEHDSSINVLLHVQSEEKRNETALRIGAGTIVCTTNLGARGTDIKAVNIEKFGGLHVILTYLPTSERTEAQALGRTARQGNFGSAQYILKGSQDTTMDDLRERRDQNEAERLRSLADNVYPSIQASDRACGLYIKSFQHILDSFRKKPSETGLIEQVTAAWRTELSEFDWAILDAYQEHWAFHLKMGNIEGRLNDDIFTDLSSPEETRNKFDFRKARDAFELTKSCFHPIRYGFQFYKQHKHYTFLGTAEASKEYFQLAIQYDPGFAAGAHVGLAYLLLRGNRVLDTYQRHEQSYKEKSIDHLSKSLHLLSIELAQLKTDAAFFPDTTPAGRHFQDKIDLHEKYMGIILHTREVVERSLRTIYCKQNIPGDKITQVVTLQSISCKLPFKRHPPQSSIFSLCCHGLTFKKDVNKSYQGLDAIQFAQEKLNDVPQISFELIGSSHLKKFAIWSQKSWRQLVELLEDTADSFIFKFTEPLFQYGNTRKLETLVTRASNVDIVICGSSKFLQDASYLISKVWENWRQIQITYYDGIPEQNPESSKATVLDRQLSHVINSLEDLPLLTGENPRVTLRLSFDEPSNAIQVLKRLTTEQSAAISRAAEENLQHRVELQIDIELKDSSALEESMEKFISASSVQFPKLNPSKCLALLEIFKDTEIDPSIHFHHLNFAEANEILQRLQNSTEGHLAQVKVLNFNQLYGECKHQPVDILTEMKNRGLLVVATFSELNGFRPTATIVVGLAALAQLSAALALTSSGLGVFAPPLVAGCWKGLWDLFVSNGLRKDFSFKKFATKQALGLAFGLGFLGASELLSLGSLSGVEVTSSRVGKAMRAPLKALIVKSAGWVADKVKSAWRKDCIEYAQEYIAVVLEDSKIQLLLANFYAINRAEHLEDGLDLSLEFYLHRWLSSDDCAKSPAWLDLFKNSYYTSATSKGVGHALKQYPDGNAAGVAVGAGLTLSAIISQGIEMIVRKGHINLRIEHVWEAIETNLEKHLSRIEMGYILTHYCSLTEAQVTKLNLPKSCAASADPFNPNQLPADAKNLDFITEDELEHARHRLEVLGKYKTEILPWGESQLSSLVANLATFVVDELIGNTSFARFKSDLVSEASQTSPATDEDKLENSQVFHIEDAPQVAQEMKGDEATECGTQESSRPRTLIELVGECEENVYLFPTANLSRRPAEAVEAITEAVLYIEKKKLDVQIIDSLTCKGELMTSIQQSPRAIFIGLEKDLSIEFVQVHERNNQPPYFRTEEFRGTDSMEKALAYYLTGVTVEEIKQEMVEQRASATAMYDKLLCIFENILSWNQ